MYCPQDLNVCIDSLCRGGGCLRNGEAMLEKCHGCGQLVSTDGDSTVFQCECEPDFYDDEPSEES